MLASCISFTALEEEERKDSVDVKMEDLTTLTESANFLNITHCLFNTEDSLVTGVVLEGGEDRGVIRLDKDLLVAHFVITGISQGRGDSINYIKTLLGCKEGSILLITRQKDEVNFMIMAYCFALS